MMRGFLQVFAILAALLASGCDPYPVRGPCEPLKDPHARWATTIDRYLQTEKKWAAGDYCVEAAGSTAEVVTFRATHRKYYDQPLHPGASEWSIPLEVEVATGIVAELGEE